MCGKETEKEKKKTMRESNFTENQGKEIRTGRLLTGSEDKPSCPIARSATLSARCRSQSCGNTALRETTERERYITSSSQAVKIDKGADFERQRCELVAGENSAKDFALVTETRTHFLY
jgi:hypothetical protein